MGKVAEAVESGDGGGHGWGRAVKWPRVYGFQVGQWILLMKSGATAENFVQEVARAAETGIWNMPFFAANLECFKWSLSYKIVFYTGNY
jgi:hypothetical protein